MEFLVLSFELIGVEVGVEPLMFGMVIGTSSKKSKIREGFKFKSYDKL